MTVRPTSLSEKIAHAEAALKSGHLNNYAPAASVKSTELKKLTSWGSAMRR
jgi:hypothetical protein